MLQYPQPVGVGAHDDPLMQEIAAAASQPRNDTIYWEIVLKKSYLSAMARFKPGTAYQAMQHYTTVCKVISLFVLLAYYFSK